MNFFFFDNEFPGTNYPFKFINPRIFLFFILIAESFSILSTTEVSSYLMPYFDFDGPRNVTVTVGQTAFLHCRVERLGDKDVSICVKLYCSRC